MKENKKPSEKGSSKFIPEDKREENPKNAPDKKEAKKKDGEFSIPGLERVGKGEKSNFKPTEKKPERKPYPRPREEKRISDKRDEKRFSDKREEKRFSDKKEEREPRKRREGDFDRKREPGRSPFNKRDERNLRGVRREKPVDPRFEKFAKKPFTTKRYEDDSEKKRRVPKGNYFKKENLEDTTDGPIRLNRYIAHAGVCSRREADVLISEGRIKVNGKLVKEMGVMVKPGDVVTYGSKTLSTEKFNYVLLNKPKGFITTTDDEKSRKTVMDLVAKAGTERIYPVGRLDRNTSGLLLLTNDGELASRLSHPSFEIKKIYKVDLDKPLSPEDLEKILAGLTLEDGLAQVNDIALNPEDPRQVGLEIHIGRNRIVRRLFESLGYDVVNLDRTVYAGLDKKNLPRGHWRHLTAKEIGILKKMGIRKKSRPAKP